MNRDCSCTARAPPFRRPKPREGHAPQSSLLLPPSRTGLRQIPSVSVHLVLVGSIVGNNKSKALLVVISTRDYSGPALPVIHGRRRWRRPCPHSTCQHAICSLANG